MNNNNNNLNVLNSYIIRYCATHKMQIDALDAKEQVIQSRKEI